MNRIHKLCKFGDELQLVSPKTNNSDPSGGVKFEAVLSVKFVIRVGGNGSRMNLPDFTLDESGRVKP